MITQAVINSSGKIPPESLKLLVLAAIVAALWIYLVHFNTTALSWPAIDNLPAVCRLLDRDCLAADFFTNASSTVNPRFPYVYTLAALAAAAGNGIGGGLAIMKSLLLVLLPSAITVVIATAIRTHSQFSSKATSNGHEAVFLAACFFAPIIVFLLQWKTGELLSVARWTPLYFDGTPQNVALALALVGFCFLFWGRRYVSFLFVFAAGVIHPAVCIFSAVFLCILFGRNFSIKENRFLIAFGLLPSLTAALFVKVLFDTGLKVTTEEFIRVYITDATPGHYLPSQFETLTRLPWYVSFFAVAAGLLIISAVLYKLNNKAWKNALVAAAVYVLAVSVQYVFVEVWPVKLVAVLGPSRFTMFGPWFLVIFSLLAMLIALDRFTNLDKLSSALESVRALAKWRFICIPGLVLLICTIGYASKSYRFDFLSTSDRELFDFVKKTAAKNDVFILPFGETRLYLPLTTGRSIFFGNGFPFSERYFTEYEKRSDLVNGGRKALRNITGSWIGEKSANYYRLLTAKNFAQIAASYKVAWVVVESDYASSFRNCKDSFSSEKYKVFAIKDLQGCANK